MINSYDDLKAQRAKAHNDLQLAKSQLDADQREWKEEAKPLAIVSSVAKKLVKNKTGKKGPVGMGVQLGINALLAKTVLKKLPFPFNLFVPHMAQNLAFNYTDKYGREALIKALHWVKDVTEVDDEIPETTELVLVESALPPAVMDTTVETLPALVEDETITIPVPSPHSPGERIPPLE